MNDFKKALGILSKAKQGGLFDKPREVIGQAFGTPVHFDSHNTKGLNPIEHMHHHDVHVAHYTYHREKRNRARSTGDTHAQIRHTTLMFHHAAVANYHGEMMHDGEQSANTYKKRAINSESAVKQARKGHEKVMASYDGENWIVGKKEGNRE